MERDSIDFKNTDIAALFRKLLLPTVLGMIFSALFVITDGIFVGKGIGSDALAAVNIVAPLWLFSTGIGLMFGVGASVVASIHLSHGKVKAARINITQSTVVSSLLLIGTSTLFCSFAPQVVHLLGGSERLTPLAVEYMVWFVPFSVFTALLNSGMFFLRLDGSPNFAMMCNIVAAVLNIILDYLFFVPYATARNATWSWKAETDTSLRTEMPTAWQKESERCSNLPNVAEKWEKNRNGSSGKRLIWKRSANAT